MGTGGRRYGAGRPASKPKTTALRHIDVRRLARDKLLTPGQSYNWAWWDDAANKTASIDLRVASRDELIVSYRIDGNTDVRQAVHLLRQACNYGGQRLWFQCPYCKRRVALLYLGKQVACRRCFRMAYPSQSDSETDALWRKYHKLNDRLTDGKRKTDETRIRLMRGMSEAQEGIGRLWLPKVAALKAKMKVLAKDFPGVLD